MKKQCTCTDCGGPGDPACCETQAALWAAESQGETGLLIAGAVAALLLILAVLSPAIFGWMKMHGVGL